MVNSGNLFVEHRNLIGILGKLLIDFLEIILEGIPKEINGSPKMNSEMRF